MMKVPLRHNNIKNKEHSIILYYEKKCIPIHNFQLSN